MAWDFLLVVRIWLGGAVGGLDAGSSLINYSSPVEH